MMQKHLILLMTSLSLMFQSSAYAHNGLFAHPQTSDELMHLSVHLLMLLPVAAGVFFLIRSMMRRYQR